MATDTERREVARRLREIRPCKSGYIEWWRIAQALGLKEPAGRFGWEKFEPDSANRLADLIEPSERACYYYDAETNHCRCYDTRLVDRDTPQKATEEMFGKMRHSTKEEADAYDAMLKSKSVEIHPVDRDALLALSDEIEKDVRTVEHYDLKLQPMAVAGYASRIREALGVDK